MKKEGLLVLFDQVGKLKNIMRAGWLRCGIELPESVADHTFRTAFISMILGDKLNLNTEKILKIALLHDISEILTGDITPYDDITDSEKSNRESIAVEQLFKEIPNGNEYIALWHEYDQQKTKEAILVRNIDKLEMALQAKEYQFQDPNLDLEEFFIDVDNKLNFPEVRVLFDELVKDNR